LALFFALSLTYLVKNELSKRNAIRAAAPALLGLSVQLSYQIWLNMTGRITAGFGEPARAVLDIISMSMLHATKHVASGVVFALLYLGLFMLPLMLFIGYGRLRDLCRQQGWIAISTSAMLFAAGTYALLSHGPMPLLPNVFYDIGLGPVMVRGAPHIFPSVGPVFWTAVTVISILTAALVLQVIIAAVLLLVQTRGQNQELLLMLLATGVIYLVPLPFIPMLFDRYLLLLVPLGTVVLFVMCCRGNALSRRWTALAVLVLLTYGAFAVAGTHDYLAWNRPRWQALRTLTLARHIRPEQIDGGFEFHSFYRVPHDKTPIGDDFLISFSPVPGYAEADRYTFRRWLPPGEGTILVLRKISSATNVRTGEDLYPTNGALAPPPMPR
jgi:hypothetical protein